MKNKTISRVCVLASLVCFLALLVLADSMDAGSVKIATGAVLALLGVTGFAGFAFLGYVFNNI